MSSAALIPLQGQLPTFNSPLSNVAQLLQTQDLASQVQLRQSQAQEYQARIAAQNRDAADIDTVKSTLAAPGSLEKLHSGDFSDFAGKVSLGTLGKLQDHYKQQVEIASKASEQEHKDKTEGLSAIQDTLGGLAGMKNPDGTPNLAAIQANWGPAVQNLEAAGAFKKAKVDPSKIPATVTSPDQIEQYASQIGAALAIQKQAAAARKEKAGTDKDLAAAAKDAIETTTKQAQQAHMSAGGLLPDEQVKAQQAAAVLAETQRQRDETARHNRVDEGTAAARERDEAARVAGEAHGMTANQVNQAATKAAQPYQKMTDAANTTLGKIDETLNLVKAGASGQELAKIGIIPALTGMNRINHTEIMAQGPGSRGVEGNIEAFFNKIAGQGSLSSDQKAQMVALLNQAKNHITSRQQIVNDHLDALGTSNSREEIQQHEHNTRQKLASFENGTVKLVAPNGQTKDVPADQVDHYLSMGAKKAQ